MSSLSLSYTHTDTLFSRYLQHVSTTLTNNVMTWMTLFLQAFEAKYILENVQPTQHKQHILHAAVLGVTEKIR